MIYDEFQLDVAIKEDFGLLVCCKGSGGGSSSGAIDYPDYMKTKHETWLDEIDVYIGDAVSPFFGVTAYNPDNDISAMVSALTSFSAAVAALNFSTDFNTAITTARTSVDTVVDDTSLNNDIAAYANLLDEDIQDNVLPEFQSGMRDIGAVNTSAFVIGEAKIWAKKSSEINKYATALRLQSQSQKNQMVMEGAKLMMDHLRTITENQKILLHYTLEIYRLKIVAKKEEADQNLAIDEGEARWDFDKYQSAANMLAAITGGVSSNGYRQPSAVQSALGGALSGAAAGSMIAPGIGTAIGAVVGGIGGLL